MTTSGESVKLQTEENRWDIVILKKPIQ